MTALRLYAAAIAEGETTLAPEESHHAVNVLRAKAGMPVEVFDGAGRVGQGSVIKAKRGGLTLHVDTVQTVAYEWPIHLTVAVGMPKSHRQGYLVEKCTELGVSSICAMLTTRSVAKPGTGAVEKWRRRAIEATRQSRRAWIPTIPKPARFLDVIAQTEQFATVFFTDLLPDAQRVATVLKSVPTGANVLALVGPEGGWTDQERQAATQAGAVPVSLGPTVQRTETAATTICAAMCVVFDQRH